MNNQSDQSETGALRQTPRTIAELSNIQIIILLAAKRICRRNPDFRNLTEEIQVNYILDELDKSDHHGESTIIKEEIEETLKSFPSRFLENYYREIASEEL